MATVRCLLACLVCVQTVSAFTSEGPDLTSWGSCSAGTYGPNCAKSCTSRHCALTSTSCDRNTGVCPDGCSAGWTGSDCTVECPTGSYGMTCNKLCSSRNCRMPSDACDHVTGACLDGCKSGWIGTDCTQGMEPPRPELPEMKAVDSNLLYRQLLTLQIERAKAETERARVETEIARAELKKLTALKQKIQLEIKVVEN